MYVKMEVESFWWLEDNCWSGALDRLKQIKENGLEDEFMDFLQIMFFLFLRRNSNNDRIK